MIGHTEGILAVMFCLGFLTLMYGIYKELYELKTLLRRNAKE